ncbi:hypothetical protein Dsin_022351 [Dipteronia sinensis]|uniref:Pentatricopeptide repeat-containing protein n=1 Tax=Dipteronia sinensis TaxID=43782 RepID=A0AAE0A2U2_9ROSI|nr:hypothetical protein Dsin_022351 [Dipteronia sinensis]
MAATLSLSPLVLVTPTSTNLANQREPRTKTMSKDSSPIATLKNCITLDEVKQLHCRVLKRGQNRDTSYVAKVISTCVEMGTFESLKYSQKDFDVFKNDCETSGTLFMYNFLIRGYSSVELGEEAILLYLELVGFGLLSDKFTFPFVLSASAKSLACSEGA